MPDEKNIGKTVIANVSELKKKDEKKGSGIPCLVQYNGEDAGKRYLIIKDVLNLGRSESNEITIIDNSVSRTHAVICKNKEKVELEDLNSANGTYLNDNVLTTKSNLNDQDMIRLGAVLFKFFSQDNMDGYIQDKIYKKATIDIGTQIFNKQYLLERLESEFRRARQTDEDLSIIYFDLDHFKAVNDNYGHNAGDQVLRDTAKVIKLTIRKDDIFARFGGEEFIVVLPRTKIDQAAIIAETMRKKTENWVHSLTSDNNNIKHKQTISLGVSQIETSMNDYKSLMESADKKLYKSKETGRNKVTY